MNEPVRILAAWLADATTGVNARLATIPRSAGDPLPASVALVDETQDNQTARERIAAGTTPLLLVWSRPLTAVGDNVVTDDGQFAGELEVLYAAARTAEAFQGRRDGGYTVRALLWALRTFRLLAVDDSARTLNQIVVLDLGPVRLEGWVQDPNDTSQQVYTVAVPYTARDLAAL